MNKQKEKRFKKLFNLDKRSNTEQNESYYNKSKIYLTQEDNDKNNKLLSSIVASVSRSSMSELSEGSKNLK